MYNIKYRFWTCIVKVLLFLSVDMWISKDLSQPLILVFSESDKDIYLNFSKASLALEISSLIKTSFSEYNDLATISNSILVSAWNSCFVLSP